MLLEEDHRHRALPYTCESPLPMAISSSSSDWSLASINSYRKFHSSTLFQSPSTLHFVSAPSSNLPLCHLNLSAIPHPVREDASTNSHISPSEPSLRQETPPDGESLNILICRLLEDPQRDGLAYEYYEKAKEETSFRPGKLTLKLLSRYLVRSKQWDLIKLLSGDFERLHVLPDSYTCSKLVSSCVKARKFKVAQRLLESFKSDEDAAVSALGSAMEAFNKLHMYRSTVDVFETIASGGIIPDSRCYFQLIEAHHKIGNTEKVIGFFKEFEAELSPSSSISPLIYGILCESLVKSNRANEALEYFRDMKRKGISANSSIYSSLIASFARNREVQVAIELFQEAKERRLMRDPEVHLKLVLMYIEEGKPEKTIDIVRAMKEAKINVSDCIFCTVVNGFSKTRGFNAAIRVYEELVSLSCEPGQVTYASIINAYFRTGQHSKAEMIFSEMEQKGHDKCVVAYSTMIALYGKTGRITEAMKLVAKMKQRGCEPNVWVYNSLMDMHGRARNMKQVEKLWKEMKRRKVAPDKVSYTTVIGGYNRAGDFDACMRMYHEFRLNGRTIDKAMAGIMIGVFSKTSRVDELVRLLQDMKIEGTELDGRLHYSALNALRDAGLETQVKWLLQSFAINAAA